MTSPVEKFKEFINSNKPSYTNNDLGIEFREANEFIRVNHYGWMCPSMYGDSPPEDGIGKIVTSFYDTNNKIYTEKGLFLKFESDDYSMRTYLLVQVSDDFSELIVKEDDYGRSGTKLIRQR